jgi:hypothetical protein
MALFRAPRSHGRLIERMKAWADQWTRPPDPENVNGLKRGDMMGPVAGEALWSAAFPLPTLHCIQANTMPRVWSALLSSPDKLGLGVTDG